MILAIPVTEDGAVEPRFGKAPIMAVATVEDGEITDWQTHKVEWDVLHDLGEHGQHHARIVRFLKDNNVERVVFAHMGPPMQHTINKMGLVLVQTGLPDARESVLGAAAIEVVPAE
jgi:predicted Fe-Mo cluster-binding NifX family protein